MLPKLLNAASRASSGLIPRSMFALVCISTCDRISSSMSSMTLSRRTKARSRAMRMVSHFIVLPLGGLPHLRDRERQQIPALFFHAELLPSRSRERVELGAATRLVHLSVGSDPTLQFDPVKRGVESALLHLEHLIRHLMNALDHAVAVQRAE